MEVVRADNQSFKIYKAPVISSPLTGQHSAFFSVHPVYKNVFYQSKDFPRAFCMWPGLEPTFHWHHTIPARHLRSSNSDRLNEPPARIPIGERRFGHNAPHIWNSLPTTVRSADSYDSFKTRLKTHIFNTV